MEVINNTIWIVRVKELVELWINVFQDRIMLISPDMTYCTRSLLRKIGEGCVKF
jgi:hypothetical protein